MSGALVPLSPATVATGSSPLGIAIHPSGNYAYSLNDGDDNISQYAISGGLLSPLSPATIAADATNTDIIINSAGTFLYSTGNNEILQFGIAGGLLSPLSPSSISVAHSISLAIANSGSFLYAGKNAVSQVAQFSITSGLLASLSPATVSSGVNPLSLAVTSDGLHAYVCNLSDNTVSQYSISSGLLSPLSPATVATGTAPLGIAIHPSGNYAYVVNTTSNTVSQYSISSGLLSPLSPATVACGDSSGQQTRIIVSPDGLYAYVVNANDNTVSQYSISSGKLTALSPATVSTGNSPVSLGISPDGAYLYVVNQGDDTISQFAAGASSIATVPQVVGMTTAAAQAAIISAGFVNGTLTVQPSLLPAGQVISQLPIAGASASLGITVYIVVSSGPSIVPNIVNQPTNAANALLAGALLAVGIVTSDLSSIIKYGNVISQTPAAGVQVLPQTPVSYVISTPTTGFNVDSTVISQYANSGSIVALVENMAQYINPGVDFANFYTFVWNVDTAQGFGLDIWGDIVGVTRLLKITGNSFNFGFKNTSVPQDWQPFDVAPFFGGGVEGQSFVLNDDAFRTLILTKALANIVATTAPALNALVRNLFPGRGVCFVQDTGSMSMEYVFQFSLTTIEYAIISQSGALPHPAGVSVTIVVP